MFCAWCGTQVPAVSYTLCSRCGKPTNGARAIPAGTTGGGNNAIAIIIGVVVGGFLVIALIGIFSAIAIPNLLTAMNRSKQKRTMADLLSVAAAIESYATDHNAYPKVSSFSELRPLLAPKYIKVLPARDGWNGELRYECAKETNGTCSGYAIGSAGKDQLFSNPTLHEYLGEREVATTNFDCDIIFADGKFVQYPQGVQRMN